MIVATLVTIAVIYVVGFVFTFWLNMHLPVTVGLAFLRSVLWPVWLASRGKWLSGERLPMD